VVVVRLTILAAACTSPISNTAAGAPICAIIPNRRKPGRTSRKISTRLPATSVAWSDRPVALPFGRVKLATTPLPTGSATTGKMIGMTAVARFAASTGSAECVTMTSTLRRTSSAIISADLSRRPSAQRYSIETVRPSIPPSSRSRCKKASVHCLWAEAVFVPRNPMIGNLLVGCPRAAIGHAATAPPSSVTNSRRLV
jgi:hypothetical protein